MTVVGELALWVALFFAAWGSVAAFGGAAVRRTELVESAGRSIRATCGMSTLACAGLLAALVSHDFWLQYVVSHTTLNTPTPYLITALWGGPPGAMLFFAVALSVCSVASLWRQPAKFTGDFPWAAGALSGVLALVLVAVCFVSNPYDRVEWVPGEGQGLDARLQSLLAAPYYASTYAAYAAAAIPFAHAVGAVVVRARGRDWIAVARRWTLVTWVFLTLSVALRMRWTYLEPMTGALWQPDLSDGASVGAWILTSVLVTRISAGRRQFSHRFVAALAMAVFCCAFAGAAAIPRPPRAGDATGTATTGGLALAGFAVVAAGAIYWGVRRLPGGRAQGGVKLRPLGLVVLWSGVAMLVVGLTAVNWWVGTTTNLRPGGPAHLTDPFGRRWRFVSQGVSRDEGMNYLSTSVALESWRDGHQAGIISAERRQYLDSVQRPIGEPALRAGVETGLALDVYVTLLEVANDSARLRIEFRPLAAFIWIGWVVVAVGGLALGTGRAQGAPLGGEIAVPVT